ncbi:hypothetical protein Z951_21340 [Streptomyces sp. PRh5]|nr:hypothetical protein Z951_21340 [Streptomyces sp. PRh5]
MAGLLEATRHLDPLMLTDDQPEPARQLSARSNLLVCSNADMGTAAVRDAEVITILADASAIVDLLAQIAPSLRAGQLVVSMAAAVTIDCIETLRVPTNHPRSSGGVLVLVEDSAESVSAADFEVGELGLLGDGCG